MARLDKRTGRVFRWKLVSMEYTEYIESEIFFMRQEQGQLEFPGILSFVKTLYIRAN